MDFKSLTNRSYFSIISRGKINSTTCILDFLSKAAEELNELEEEIMKPIKGYDKNRVCEEAMDLANVCINMVKWLGREPEEEFIKVIEKNEKRAENR